MSLLGYIGLTLGLFAVLAPLNYWALKSRLGRNIAHEKIPEIIITTASLVVILILNSITKSEQWSAIKAIVWISCTALLWTAFAVLALRKPKAGTVLLNLGRPNKRQVWLLPFAGIMGSIVLFLILGLPSSSTTRAEGLSLVALVWSLGIVFALMGWKETLVTEKGVRTGYTGFEWKQIKNYMWSGMNKDHHYLFFKLKHRPPLANTSLLDVPDELRQTVREIVIQHISTTSSQ